MAYTDIYAAAVNVSGVLMQQVTVAMFQAAVDIVNEDPSTPNHDNRLVWARKATDSVGSLQIEAQRWIWKVLENASIQAAPEASSDNDVQFVVNSIIPYIVQR